MSKLILASTSTFRRELLARLGVPFSSHAPDIGEDFLPGERPAQAAERLAQAKAEAVAIRHPHAIVIGSDQVAYSGSEIFGKPGTRERARQQLTQMSGKEIVFHTGLCVLNATAGQCDVLGIENRVGFRHLTAVEIDRYLDREDALNCAGSAKSEGLGISLLTHIRGDDPNALIGLPLIALCTLLRKHGFDIP
jgi:septum formation protein